MSFELKLSKYLRISLLAASLFLVGCHPTLQKEAKTPEQALKKVRFFYPRFQDDMDYLSLMRAVGRSLEYLDRLGPDETFEYGNDQYSVKQVQESLEAFIRLIIENPDPKDLNKQIREKFLVYRATGRVRRREVLFTGYFEPVYDGNLMPDEYYAYPLYRKPDDLIKIDLSPFREEFKGKSIIAKIEDKSVSPYYSREEIETEKVLQGRNLEVAWLKNPLDVTFL